MNLKHLTDQALLGDTKNLALKEKEISLNILYHLLEIEDRKLYSELKYSSLFEYCVRHLGYSEGAAQRRISSARLMKKSPITQAALEKKEINLTQASLLASHVNTNKEADLEELLDLAKKSGSTEKLKEKLRTASAPTEIKLSLSFSKEELTEVQKLKSELSLTSEKELFLKLVRLKSAELEKKQFKTTDSPRPLKSIQTKCIPSDIKRRVAQKAQGKCENCSSNYKLEFHHITPRSFGGEHTQENLKLLCHNCHARQSYTFGFLR
jgi:hypothetical protein